MNATVLISSAVLLSALQPLSSVSPLIAQATEPVSQHAQAQSSMTKRNGNSTAAGHEKDAGAEKVDEKLKACLSRIPAGSSRGQRLLAEQSCQNEYEVRSARHAAPEF